MPARIARSPAAVRDLYVEWAYLLENASENVADRFLQAVEKTSEMLLLHPKVGRLHPSTRNSTRKLRKFPITLPFGAWLLLYIPTSKGITVVRVIHGSRHPSDFLP